MCQRFSHFTAFLHHLVLAKLATTSSIGVKTIRYGRSVYLPLFWCMRRWISCSSCLTWAHLLSPLTSFSPPYGLSPVGQFAGARVRSIVCVVVKHDGRSESAIAIVRTAPRPHPFFPWGRGKGWNIERGKGIRFIALCPLKCSHDLPSQAGLYTRKPFQSPERYSRAAGSI